MRRILPFTLAIALLLTGCGGPAGGTQDPGPASATPDGGSSPSPGASSPAAPPVGLAALAQAKYPQFPTWPEEPKDGEDWSAWFDAQSGYYQAVTALRADCDPALVRNNSALMDFAARSAPLAIAGHEGRNAIYSPVSLWSALVLCVQCAHGDTQAQLLAALGAEDAGALRSLMRQVWLMLYTDDGRDALTLANSVWLNAAAQGHYVQDTLDILAKDCFSGVYSVPMGTDEADRAVTDWVSEQTHGLIGGDEPVVRTNALTLAVLASSLYYRAGWEDEFYQENTYEDTFTAADGQESRVDFMHSTRDGLFLLRDGWQAAYLPTRLGEMVFVLPDEGVTPESLLDDPEFLNSLKFIDENWEHADPTVAAHRGEVQWSVPKFDVNSNLDLMETLKSLGITDLPDPDRSDLSNLTDIPACLSRAFQLARVKVDEEGVEAAAVTLMTMDAMAAMPTEDPEVCVMDLDRPFLFVVRSQDLPLFVGVVNQM